MLDVGGGVHQYVGPYISGDINFDAYMKNSEQKLKELRSVVGNQSCIDKAIEILREYNVVILYLINLMIIKFKIGVSMKRKSVFDLLNFAERTLFHLQCTIGRNRHSTT